MAIPHETTRILHRLLDAGLETRAERLLARMHPADLGPVLSDLTPTEVRRVIDLLFRQRRAADTLKELPPEILPQILEAIADERLAQVIARLERDDMLELVERIDEERRERVVGLMPDAARVELRKAQLYPESSAGRAMTPNFVALHESTTAQEAIERIRQLGEATEEVLYLYVVDEKERLQGVVPIRRLVSASPARACRDMMVSDPVSVLAEADQEQVAQLVARYNLLAIPVTDAESRLLGVITVDDVIDVIQEEATEDMYHLAGLHEEDRVFSPAPQAVRQRLPWMFLTLAAAFATAWVVGLFERTLDQLVTLAIFLPVVAMLGGNLGIQALTVITRAIALGELEFASAARAILKELSVGLMVGAAIGTVSAGAVYLWKGNPYLGLVLFLSLIITLAIAGLVGASVPLMLKALRQDPALGSGVLVTAVTDIFGFVTFLGTATLLLDRLM